MYLYIKQHILPDVPNRLTQVYADYSASLAEINPDDDLHWFSLNAGVDMPYSWPEFEVIVERVETFLFPC